VDCLGLVESGTRFGPDCFTVSGEAQLLETQYSPCEEVVALHLEQDVVQLWKPTHSHSFAEPAYLQCTTRTHR
jgi:hypothetical protein